MAKRLLSCKIIIMGVRRIRVFNFAVKPIKKKKQLQLRQREKLRHWREWLRSPLSEGDPVRMMTRVQETWGKDHSALRLWASV